MQSPLEGFDRRNLLTYVSLMCGLGACAAARAGNVPVTGMVMALAVIADTFDGRFARLFASDNRRKALGAQLDSLADAATFGLAPALCAILLADSGGASSLALWISGFAYLASAVTRLAFFNLTIESDLPGGFVGVPVPVAALIWASALLLRVPSYVIAIVLVIGASLMIAPLRISRPGGRGLALFVCWPVTRPSATS